jgi:adenine deaminase
MPRQNLSDLIDQGRGIAPADIVLKGGRVFGLITGDLVETDVAICGDTIVGVFGTYEGRQVIDCAG